jgi:hypothetical protein
MNTHNVEDVKIVPEGEVFVPFCQVGETPVQPETTFTATPDDRRKEAVPAAQDRRKTAATIATVVPDNQNDLVGRITTMLSIAAHPNPTLWTARLEADAYNMDRPLEVRQYLINRALRLILGQGVNTMDVRYCLIEGTTDRWLELVQQMVVPCLVEQNLPRTQS